MKTIIRLLAIVLFLFVFTSVSFAVEYRPYAKAGGMELSENGTSEGHKAFAVVGLDVLQYLDEMTATYTLEFLKMIEAEDDDPEMIHEGYKAGAEIKLNNWLTPYIGAYAERLHRKPNPKYPNSFSTLDFIDLTFGIEATHSRYYARIGGNYPVWVDGPDGRPDLTASAGVNLGNWDIGAEYRKLSFSGDENQPILRMRFPAFRIGYKF